MWTDGSWVLRIPSAPSSACLYNVGIPSIFPDALFPYFHPYLWKRYPLIKLQPLSPWSSFQVSSPGWQIWHLTQPFISSWRWATSVRYLLDFPGLSLVVLVVVVPGITCTFEAWEGEKVVSPASLPFYQKSPGDFPDPPRRYLLRCIVTPGSTTNPLSIQLRSTMIYRDLKQTWTHQAWHKL